MKLLFAGSGEFGIPTLQFFHEAIEYDLIGVLTQPDRPAGRKRQPAPTAIANWAVAHNIPILKTEDVNTESCIDQVEALQVDATIVIAFGQKIGEPLIAAMGQIALNLHASLLPKYRGAAPINWAMIHGEKTSGVSVIALAKRMDAGDIYTQDTLEINPDQTAGELHDRLAQMGPGAIMRVLANLQRGTLQPQPQNHVAATRAPKLTKSDGTVCFNQPAEAVRNRIHGLTPWPGCTVRWHRTAHEGSVPLRIHRVKLVSPARCGKVPPGLAKPGTVLTDLEVLTAQGIVQLQELQAPGGKAMAAYNFAQGHPVGPGDRLSPAYD